MSYHSSAYPGNAPYPGSAPYPYGTETATGNLTPTVYDTKAPIEAVGPSSTRQRTIQRLSSPGGLSHQEVMANLVGPGRDGDIPAIANGGLTPVTSVNECQPDSQRYYGLEYSHRVLKQQQNAGQESAAAQRQCETKEYQMWKGLQEQRFDDATERLQRDASEQQQTQEASEQLEALRKQQTPSQHPSHGTQYPPQQPYHPASYGPPHGTQYTPQDYPPSGGYY